MAECDFLDVSHVGKIQSEGYLVLLHPGQPPRVRSVSSNICQASFAACTLQNNPRLFIDTPIPKCFSKLVSDEMSALLERHLGTHCWFKCDVSKMMFFMTLVATRNGHLFEIFPDEHEGRVDVLNHGRVLSGLMAHHSDCDSLFGTTCSAVTDLVEYDRCFVYQFQQDLSGKVVYERIRPEMVGTIEPWIDTYFPASDIPLPARQMFTILPLRVIFDNQKSPVDVVGNPQDGATDLSKSALRASHPVHTTYLKNMGVRSCMSIGIMVDSELWGLLCFHSYGEARGPRGWETSFFNSLSVPVSANISRIHRDAYEKRRESLTRVIDQGFSSTGVSEFFQTHALDLLKVMGGDCMSILAKNRVQSWGDSNLVLTEDAIKRILRNTNGRGCAIGKVSEPRRGVLCVAHADLVVAFIRKSVVGDKVWGGDPFQKKIMRPDGVPGPRGSFARYVQSDADSLNKWDSQDQHLGTHLSGRIKLLSTTLRSFSNKLELLDKSAAPRTTGQVDYSTFPATIENISDPALVSHFSHELKTPLHGLSSTLALLLDDYELTPREARAKLLYGMECVRSVQKVAGDVLSIVGGHGMPATKGRAERICVQGFVDTLRGKFGHNKSFTASNSVPEEHGQITIDRDGLHDALSEMIYNSFSNSLPDTERVHLSVKCHATHREAVLEWKDQTTGYTHRNIRNSEDTGGVTESDAWYTFSVQDKSCGVHRDMMENVLGFGDQKRPSATLAHSHQGAGVGLYRCVSNVVFHMNGSVCIASTVSEGTVVSLMVPAPRVERFVPDKQNKQIGDGDIGTFLVVDDNSVNRKLAARMVTVAFTKKVGVVPMIKEFSDGKMCVLETERMVANGEKILGILLDHHMPVMTGKEAASIIRQIESKSAPPGHGIPILGFTADMTEQTKKELLDAGMDDVLPKPLPMSLLEETCVKLSSAAGS